MNEEEDEEGTCKSRREIGVRRRRERVRGGGDSRVSERQHNTVLPGSGPP